MSVETIERDFKAKVSDRIRLMSEAIFEDQKEVNRKVLGRFSDVCEKQFSSLSANKDRISHYIGEILSENT